MSATVIRAGAATGIAGTELNATPVAWGPGEATVEHRSDERELLLVVVAGSAVARAGGEVYRLTPGDCLLIARGTRWQVVAGDAGVRSVSIHLRRPPLQVER